MAQLKHTLFLLISLLIASSGRAQDVAGVYRGESAPFTGVLISSEAAAKIIAEHRQYAAQLRLEIEHADANNTTVSEYAVKECEIANAETVDILSAQLKSEQQRVALLTKSANNHKFLWGFMTATATAIVGIVVYGVLTK